MKGNQRESIVQRALFACVIAAAIFCGCKKGATLKAPTTSTISVENRADGIHIISSQADFVLTPEGHLLANRKEDGRLVTIDKADQSSGIVVNSEGKAIDDFVRDMSRAKISEANGKLGPLGKQVKVKAHSASTGLDEVLTVELYNDFPTMAVISAAYTNSGKQQIALTSVELQKHQLSAALQDASLQPHEMWAFFGSSLKWGKDDVLPIPAKFSQENPFGAPVETGDDLGRVGGGIPVVAFWTRNTGLAIGHLETLPLMLSIPTRTTEDGSVEVEVKVPAEETLKQGDTFSTPRTFVTVFRGDYFEPLNTWSRAIAREGLTKPRNNAEDYAVSWCGWGYESDVTPKQMIDTIPKLKELGIHWATLDDRWFNNYGDWEPRADTFGGDAIQKMVEQFHEQGMKVQLWWLPLAVEDGKYRYGDHKYVVSDVVKEHPDWLILDKKGQHARMARNLAALCPALPEVQEYYKHLTERFIRDWGFDGSKLDNIYTVPLCYNPKHHHKSPLDSVYAMGKVYKTIFETTRALKPDSVTQACPCGTPPSLAWLRDIDQAVTADPVGSVQVRRRIKMYKALLGPTAAIYGDHVELTRITGENTGNERDLGEDFASTLGTGGVLGTKFTWPDYGPKLKDVYLNPSKEAHWKKWIALYNEKMLSKGTFLDLYVYGYDVPEAYAIEKDGDMYYAFYAPAATGKSVASIHSNWKGVVELRGLQANRYRVKEYVNDKDFGTVSGPTAKVPVEFTGSLLLEADEVAQNPAPKR
jgi:alpha-galactosidase